MSMNQLLEIIRSFDGILELAPGEGSEFPEVAWGDHFFYYAPDGQVPQREQPYATIVTKDYPDDTHSDLNRDGRWRLNIHVGAAAFTELTGEEPRTTPAEPTDHTATNVVLPHPVYRAQGWVCIVVPDTDPHGQAVSLLRQAHHYARRRAERRDTASGSDHPA
ncbi:DUF6194 family protein [Ornithinimicrobium faecis]|uniref:DUF6194 family protein n=1 Tax=Ornithinimicrobium faecis TaxID=2934158 RepID=A0ABY4YXE8_9MICO|nr:MULTISPECIES: DUF6194 family protein [unclassified Ornithinimicrobium]USQ81430.1 DUF6194 family protein [Ornithinimicrobium sp. HY1793]